MKIKDQPVVLNGTAGTVIIQRMADGFPRIESDEEIDLYYGLGYLHGHDRQMQMWLTKIIGQGRASECIKADNELVELDKYMRWINLGGDAAAEVKQLSNEVGQIFQAYCRGVNDAVSGSNLPLEFRLIGYKPDSWTPEDIILVVKMLGFVGLSQSQGDVEKFIMQIIRNDVDPLKIKELFPYIKEDIPDDLVEIIKQVKLSGPIIPEAIKWLGSLAGFSASNNWAVSPAKTASGQAILCGDPHLAIQLPSIWYSALMISQGHYMMGATVPGIPCVVLGRSPNLAWAVTYGTMDMIDYFIEEVKDQKYRRGDKWLPFVVSEEVIKPKKQAPVVMKIYENDHGVLEGEPIEDGYYLSHAWTGRKGTAAETANNLFKVPHAKNAEEALDLFARLPFGPYNWVTADTGGNIGYQLSGLYPQKAENTSGLLPYLGWDENQDWQGMISPDGYPRVLNPKQGYIVTANQDLNDLGVVAPMTLPMSSYRADRISDLLERGESLTTEDMKKMHYDLYSIQAEAFMAIIAPLLPASENGDILKNWDLRYDADSLGATLFERIYRELLRHVFGENGMGADVVEYMIDESSMFAMLHGNFDQVLLKETSVWFAGQPREEIYRLALDRGLKKPAVPYGQTRKIYIPNIFFGGRLPKIFGFDYGPYEHVGSRATIPQSQIFKAMGHPATFAATFRMIVDMDNDELLNNLPGGPSDRRFSRYYRMGLAQWMSARYHVYKP
ncbi:MAG: penicillin acylase family protein [Desulfobacteraceae bacterium]|jgi:penicillin amidase|nr:penicillin acylase family protein [Desulfobacteraceae bacterium]